jgi:hypothetical protein
MLSWKEDFIFMPYSNLWRECRKLFHQGEYSPYTVYPSNLFKFVSFMKELSPSNVEHHEPNALKASRLLINSILETPEDWRYKFR